MRATNTGTGQGLQRKSSVLGNAGRPATWHWCLQRLETAKILGLFAVKRQYFAVRLDTAQLFNIVHLDDA